VFGFSSTELLVIVLLLVIVIKPEDIPAFFNLLGRWYHKWLRIYYSFLDEINNYSKEETKK
jgi:Sec-independent protein translocase protein TatA